MPQLKTCYCAASFAWPSAKPHAAPCPCLCLLLQVLAQPLYATIEDLLLRCFPGLAHVKEWAVRAVYRCLYVVFSGVLAIALPFFSSIVGLIGAISYWPTAGEGATV
jgi:hypothetical protein